MVSLKKSVSTQYNTPFYIGITIYTSRKKIYELFKHSEKNVNDLHDSTDVKTTCR